MPAYDAATLQALVVAAQHPQRCRFPNCVLDVTHHVPAKYLAPHSSGLEPPKELRQLCEKHYRRFSRHHEGKHTRCNLEHVEERCRTFHAEMETCQLWTCAGIRFGERSFAPYVCTLVEGGGRRRGRSLTARGRANSDASSSSTTRASPRGRKRLSPRVSHTKRAQQAAAATTAAAGSNSSSSSSANSTSTAAAASRATAAAFARASQLGSDAMAAAAALHQGSNGDNQGQAQQRVGAGPVLGIRHTPMDPADLIGHSSSDESDVDLVLLPLSVAPRGSNGASSPSTWAITTDIHTPLLPVPTAAAPSGATSPVSGTSIASAPLVEEEDFGDLPWRGDFDGEDDDNDDDNMGGGLDLDEEAASMLLLPRVDTDMTTVAQLAASDADSDVSSSKGLAGYFADSVKQEQQQQQQQGLPMPPCTPQLQHLGSGFSIDLSLFAFSPKPTTAGAAATAPAAVAADSNAFYNALSTADDVDFFDSLDDGTTA